jgi:membrane associated rhomboid family serine protease
MSWYERDYARQAQRRGPSFAGAGPRWLVGGSVVTTIMIVNVVVFLLGEISPWMHVLLQGGVRGVTGDGRPVWEAGLFEMRADLVLHGQLWRLITAQYLHAGTAHLVFNMIALHFLGRFLEQRWSVRRFLGIYTVCGMAGNVFYTLLAFPGGLLDPQTPAVGASGSIYGLLGLAAVLAPSATVYIYFLFPVRIRTLAIVLGVISFLTIQTQGRNFGGEACHLAGLVFGVWWGARGEAWWDSTEWRFLSRRGPGKKRRSNNAFLEGLQQQREDEALIDRILGKVSSEGMQSLTEREKEMLREATARQQEREARLGRVDRI